MDAAEQLRSQDASLFHRSGGSWIILCGAQAWRNKHWPPSFFLDFMCMTAWPTCKYEHHTNAWCLWRSLEGRIVLVFLLL